MTRVKIAFIADESKRKATFKLRKKSLLKKVEELSTLCDIEAGAIVYSPFDPQPEVWPTDAGGIEMVLARFKTMPETEQTKKMMNQERFLEQSILKTKEKVKKEMKKNREKEMTMLMFQYLQPNMLEPNSMSMDDFNDFSWLIDRNLEDVTKRLEALSFGNANETMPDGDVNP